MMKVHELLAFNGELLRRLCIVGIKPDDYRYLDLYQEYERRVADGEKVTYIVATLAVKYGVSERQVYNVISKLGSDVIYCKPPVVE